MFASFYQLQEQPFGVNPDPRYLYLSKTHREVFSSLLYRIQTDCGFLAMIAPPGMGKTTLLFHLLSRLQRTARTAFVFQTQCNSNEFMRYLLSEFGSTANTADPVQMFQALKTILVTEANEGRRCIVFIDEAQNLQAEVLETIRLLSDFETPRRKLLQIILSGQLELEGKLGHPGLIQLRQRLSSISRLQQFGTEETVLYIAHRLTTAGYQGTLASLFDGPALARIVILSGGIPRVINNVCFNALSLGFAMGARQIDSSIIEEVACDLGIGEPFQPPSTLLSEIDHMLLAAAPEELSKSDNRPMQEVHTAVSTQPEAAESQGAAGGSAEAHDDSLLDDGVEARTPEVIAQAETAVAVVAQAAVTPEKPEQKLEKETTKKAAAAPAVPVPVAANSQTVRTRTKVRRSRNGSHSLTPGKLPIVQRMGIAGGLALLLGIGVFLYVEHRGAARSVEAKSAVRMPERLRSPENSHAAASPPIELGRAHDGNIAARAMPLSRPKANATALAPADGNPRQAPAVRAADAEERLLESSQLTLPESVLQTQMTVPADAPFMVADAATATASPIQLPALKDAPPRVIAAPAMLKSASSVATIVPPRAISRRPPVYPEFAKSSRLQGDVMLLVSISSTGAVRNAKALSGNKLLAAAAENAALHWIFTPGLRNGVAIDSQTQVLVRFQLQ